MTKVGGAVSKKAKANSESKDIWFPAKKYGYGWGVPLKWQGWAALLGLLGLGLAPLVYLSIWYNGDAYCQSVITQGIDAGCDPHAETGVYLLAALFWLIACCLVLFQVCTLKGEKAKWRWSGSTKHATES
jgi:hypothetical protein